VGKPTIQIEPTTVLKVELRRPQWEYKQVKVVNPDEVLPILTSEGAQGWETTGVTFAAPGGTLVVLKRIK
jgi:hypothetical protein